MPAPEPVHVITREDASEAEIDSALVWVAQRRKMIAAVIAIMCTGAAAAWQGLKQVEATAEERVLRRQAAERQSRAVAANGKAVGRLHERMGDVERAVAANAEMTRTSVELLMANPSVRRAVARDATLRARAAKFVDGGSR
jgi:hypothetical protein